MRGRSLPVSIPRRIVTDYMRLSATMPSVPIERTMDLGAVAAARNACSPCPPWAALFGKAFAVTAQELTELWRVFLKWPWPHLYEYPASVAMFAIDRVYHGDAGGVFLKMRPGPLEKNTPELWQLLRRKGEGLAEQRDPRRARRAGIARRSHRAEIHRSFDRNTRYRCRQAHLVRDDAPRI